MIAFAIKHKIKEHCGVDSGSRLSEFAHVETKIL